MKRILFPKGTEMNITNNVIEMRIPFNKFSADEVFELKENAEVLQNLVKCGLHMFYEEIRIVSKNGDQQYKIKPETLTIDILENAVVQKGRIYEVSKL